MKSLIICIALLAVTAFGNETIVDIAVSTPSLSTLVTALKAGNLVTTLSGKGPFTVFAPTNDAFAALPAGVVADLLKPENQAKLVDLLLYHVVSGSAASNNFWDGEMVRTVEKGYVTIRIAGHTILINSAKVLTADIKASNGLIHIIDAVLMPPAPPAPTPTPNKNRTIVDIAVATPALSTLVAALKAATLVTTLAGPGPFTVFAPTNDAFMALPAGTVANLLKPANKAALQDILLYHVVPGALHTSALLDGERLKTAEGKYVMVRIDGKEIYINDSKIAIADVNASNGVVHVVDAVLLPS